MKHRLWALAIMNLKTRSLRHVVCVAHRMEAAVHLGEPDANDRRQLHSSRQHSKVKRGSMADANGARQPVGMFVERPVDRLVNRIPQEVVPSFRFNRHIATELAEFETFAQLRYIESFRACCHVARFAGHHSSLLLCKHSSQRCLYGAFGVPAGMADQSLLPPTRGRWRRSVIGIRLGEDEAPSTRMMPADSGVLDNVASLPFRAIRDFAGGFVGFRHLSRLPGHLPPTLRQRQRQKLSPLLQGQTRIGIQNACVRHDFTRCPMFKDVSPLTSWRVVSHASGRKQLTHATTTSLCGGMTSPAARLNGGCGRSPDRATAC